MRCLKKLLLFKSFFRGKKKCNLFIFMQPTLFLLMQPAFTKQGCDGQHQSHLTLNKKTHLAIFHYKPSGGRKGRAR